MDTLAQSKTDPESNTCVDAHCDCRFVWSLAQQYAMAQLDTRTPILKNGTPDYRFSSHSIKETPIESGDASFVGTKFSLCCKSPAGRFELCPDVSRKISPR